KALQEMVASWTMTAAPAGQRPAYAGPPIQVEKLKPPAGGREFVLTQADGTLVFSQQGDKDAEDLAAHVTQVYRIASATLQRAGPREFRRIRAEMLKIDRVRGGVVVAADGLVITSSLPRGIAVEPLAALTATLGRELEVGADRLKRTPFHTALFSSDDGTVFLG